MQSREPHKLGHLGPSTEPLTQSLLDHPYQRYIGVELVSQSYGSCRTCIVVSGSIDNLSNTLHGGVLYSVSDTTSMLAAVTVLNSGEYALTASYSASLLATASLGQVVHFHAAVLKAGKRMIFLRCDAYAQVEDGSDRLLFTANISKARFRSNAVAQR